MLVRGTTPTHTFTLPFDTEIVGKIKVTYAQNDVVVLEKEQAACECSGNTVTVRLTQEDTFKFDCKQCVQIQVRVLTQTGDALVSEIKHIGVRKCLDGEVLA